MAKRKSTPSQDKTEKKVDETTVDKTTETQAETESKLAALVEVEEQLDQETAAEDKPTPAKKAEVKEEVEPKKATTKAKGDSDDKPAGTKAKVKPDDGKSDVSDDNKVDGVIVNPEDATQQPENGKNEISTMGNIKLDETNVKSRAESLGESLQEGEEDRRVAIPGKVALKAVPPQVDMDTATNLEKTEAEAEAISTMVNDSLPNKPAPEQIHEEVKADAIITRAANLDVEAYKATQDLPIDLAATSTETNHLDEIPVPAGEYAMSEREMQVRRIQENNMPILRQNSREDIIDRKRPLNVFQKLAEAKESRNETTRVKTTSEDMAEKIQEKFGLDVRDPKTNDFLRNIVETLDDYVKRMSPRSPIPTDQMVEQQKNLTRLLAGCFEREPKVGVLGLQIVEEYFRVYSNGAFGGSYPFRAFNSLAPKYAELSNVLYAIQNIVKDGKQEAMRTISKQKLKESVGTQDGQMVLLSYLNS